VLPDGGEAQSAFLLSGAGGEEALKIIKWDRKEEYREE
jgi:hypothetical protein